MNPQTQAPQQAPAQLPDQPSAGRSTGSPDAPDFKPRRGMMIGFFLLYFAFMGTMIYWAIQLRERTH